MKVTQKEALINLVDGLPVQIKICFVLGWLGDCNFHQEAAGIFSKLDEGMQKLVEKIVRNTHGNPDTLNAEEDHYVKIYKVAHPWTTPLSRIFNYSITHDWKGKGEGEKFVNELLTDVIGYKKG